MAGKDGKDEFFHKLAVDERGIGFPLPRDAVAWRIQRMPPGRGRPMPLYKAGDGEARTLSPRACENVRFCIAGRRAAPSSRNLLAKVDCLT